MKKFILLLTGIAVNTGACKPEMHRHRPETLGERTNQQGVVTQRIVRETSYTSENVPLTPEGPRKRINYQVSYFLEEPDNPRREFSAMRSADFSHYEKYWPVENTAFWVATGIDPIGNKDKLYFVLFDEKHIIRTNVFKVVPKWKSEKSEYELRDGNHTLTLRTPEGQEKYDVLADEAIKLKRKEQ